MKLRPRILSPRGLVARTFPRPTARGTNAVVDNSGVNWVKFANTSSYLFHSGTLSGVTDLCDIVVVSFWVEQLVETPTKANGLESMAFRL